MPTMITSVEPRRRISFRLLAAAAALVAAAVLLASGSPASFTRSSAAAPSSSPAMLAAAVINADLCPPGHPVPYGVIGDIWRRPDVQYRIGCPGEPEHDVAGRRGRLQTFTNGQIAWTPDQGSRMTIWAIRDKAHFRVQWSSNDPGWSYDRYLIRWDRDGRNIGQRDISGTTEGWWDFQFDTPGTYTFIVEGRSGGGYHHGWTIAVGGTVRPGDIPPAPKAPAPQPRYAVEQLSVTNTSPLLAIRAVQWTIWRQDLGPDRPEVAKPVGDRVSVTLPVGRQYYIHADVWVLNSVSGQVELAEFVGTTKIKEENAQVVFLTSNHVSPYNLIAVRPTGSYVNPVVVLTR